LVASLQVNIDKPSWMERAACIDMPLDVFFPGPGRLGAADTRKAVAICRQCPVRQACLDYALEHPDMAGVWGGTSHRERNRIHKGATPPRYDAPNTTQGDKMTDPDQSIKAAIRDAMESMERAEQKIRDLTFQIETLGDHRGQMRKALNELVRVLEESPTGLPYLSSATLEVIVALKLGGFND
jgi:WhiB family redox-sensing transcriptional regulator